LIIQTTLNLSNSSALFYKDTVLANGKTQYLILEQKKIPSSDCGFTPLVNSVDTPMVDFYLEGPQFTQPLAMPTGMHYGGITVDVGKSMVTVDSAKIDSLIPGAYRITFTSTFDKSRTGYLVFTVPPLPPEHLDILTDSLVLDPKTDAPVDSVFIPMDQPAAQAYSVLRDKLGNYLSNASAEKWTSRDTAVVTVALSPTDKSRVIITKTGTGSTWVVVTQAGLRADSLRVSAIALPQYPIISSAIMLDTNADIIPDMLSITLNDTFHVDQMLDSVVVSYRGLSYTVTASDTRLIGTNLLVPFKGPGTSDARPSGVVSIFMNVKLSEKSYSKPFVDGIGPALISATVLENDGSNPDILYLAFSEPVTPATLSGKQLLLMSANSSDTIPLTVNTSLNTTNDSVYIVTLGASAKPPLSGDRVRLVPGSSGGGVADKNANKPHDLNRSVVLGFKPGPTSIISAYYRDVNADGYIDAVIVGFKRPVQPSDIQALIVQWNIQPSFQYDTISQSSFVKLNDSLYSLPLKGAAIRPTQIRTSVIMEIDVAYSAFPGIIRSLPVADSAAPVVVSASLKWGSYSAGGNTRSSDTLSVVFSEPVQNIGAYPFLVSSKKDGSLYRFQVTPLSTSAGTSWKFLVVGIDNTAVTGALPGDSLWIDPIARIGDKGGVLQLNAQNRKVALDIVMQPPEWAFTISKNPFAPGTDISSEISVAPKTPIIDADQFSWQISIYDVIGNLVIAMPMAPKGKGWAYLWNGRNKNARIVGSGLYSAIVKTFKNNQEYSTKRLRIGVKP
jgi:hypothetical protein